MIETDDSVYAPIRRSIHVRANAARAFKVFTEDVDTWWPRTHHIGKSPMTRAVIEGHIGGRCYSDHEGGTESDWGRVVEWEPPRRFVMAWLIAADWSFEPDASKCSEVEVRFTAQPDGSTFVELEHRAFERMGESGAAMRVGVGSEGGWGSLMELFREIADKSE